MTGFTINLDNATLNNQNFRKVLYTAPNSQLVVMTLQPGEEIGTEIHHDVDQYIVVKSGIAEVIMNNESSTIGPDFVAAIPAGVEHNIINKSADSELRLYTIYAPAEHADGTIHRTKEEAAAAEHHE